MSLRKWLCLFLLSSLTKMAFTQQMLLGNMPSVMNKSAVLELNADNQGLLLPRINDTTAINTLNPPDGMVIYFVPTRRLLLRTQGFWSPLAPASSSISFATGTTGTDVSITGSPVTLGGTVTLNLPSSSSTARGLLTSADWTTFNNKQAAGNYLTGLTGDVTASGPGAVAATISNNAVTNAKFRQSAALSIIGNATSSTANVSDITSTADNQFLVRRSGALTFGTISSSDIPTLNQNTSGSAGSVSGTNIVSNSNLSQMPSSTIKANPTGAIANAQDITLGAGLAFSGASLVNTISNTNQLTNGAGFITNANVVFNNQANTYTAGMKQTFRGSTTSAGVSFGGALTSDPTTLASGDLWFRSDAGKLRFFDGTTSRYLATEGGSISGTQNFMSKFGANGTSLTNSSVFDDGSRVGIGTNAPTAAFHVKAASNPMRVEGLQSNSSGSVLVVDASGNFGISSSLQISFFTKGSFTLDLPSIANNGNLSVTLNVPGAEIGDNVIVTPSGELVSSGGTGLVTIGYSYVPSAGKVTIRFLNPTQSSTDVPPMTFYITVFR